ncbi:hypothetical protein M5689_007844 [Euphorbia peplus]|nr:hypothetical protein M5689_007844 [Euphorbia peplus]
MTPDCKILSDECGNLAISTKPGKPDAIRDCPPNCGPAAKGLPFQAEENSKLQGSVDDPKSTNTTEQFGFELETKNEQMPMFSVNAGLSDPSKTEVCENTTLPDEGQQIATNVPLPRRRIPAERDFPSGCGRNAAPIFTVLETSGLDENIAEGEETMESGDKNNVASTNGGEDMFQSRSISSGMEEKEEEEDEEEMQVNNVPPSRRYIPAKRDFPPGCGGNAASIFTVLETSGLHKNIAEAEETTRSGEKNNVSSTNGGEYMFPSRSISSAMDEEEEEEEEEEEMQVNDDNKSVDGELSEHITQKKDLTSSELSGRPIIVQGLMATKNCPWTNNSRRKFC